MRLHGVRGWRAVLVGAMFRVYRGVVSPALQSSGLGRCRYLPSCSEYAEIALLRHGVFRGLAMAAARLVRCHPWSEGGLDPVPPVRSGGALGR